MITISGYSETQMSSWDDLAYQCSKVVPDFGDVRIEAYRTGIRIECISVLVDLVIQDTNRAPERRVPAVAVHGLLIRFIRLGILLL